MRRVMRSVCLWVLALWFFFSIFFFFFLIFFYLIFFLQIEPEKEQNELKDRESDEECLVMGVSPVVFFLLHFSSFESF